MQKRKKGDSTLRTFFPISQYMAAVLIALCYPRLTETVWLLPNITGHRAWLLLWVVVLLGLSVLMDRAHLKAYYRDLWEIENKVKNGNLPRSTLLAIGVPLMLIVDFVAIAHLYLSYFKSGAGSLEGQLLIQHTAAMAIGMVLWIYGRFLPKIPHRSIWGLRTKTTMADQLAWGKAHLKAVPWACISGAIAFAAAAFLPVLPGFTVSVICCIAAFIGMFASAK